MTYPLLPTPLTSYGAKNRIFFLEHVVYVSNKRYTPLLLKIDRQLLAPAI